MSKSAAASNSLTERERSQLVELVWTLQKSPLRAKRPRIILLAESGLPNTVIGRKLGLSPQTISRWRKRYAESGITALTGPPKKSTSSNGVLPAVSPAPSSAVAPALQAPTNPPEKPRCSAPGSTDWRSFGMMGMPSGSTLGSKGGWSSSTPLANGTKASEKPALAQAVNRPTENGQEGPAPAPVAKTNGSGQKPNGASPPAQGDVSPPPANSQAGNERTRISPDVPQSAPVTPDAKLNSANGRSDINGFKPASQTNGEPVKPIKKDEAPPRPTGKEAKSVTAQGSDKGGGKGGGGNAAGLHQRSDDPDFRSALSNVVKALRRHAISVGIFSVVLNLLILAIPIYLFQVSDRVLTSRSQDTLVMLTIVVIGALLIHVFLDMMRRYLLLRAAVQMETSLGAPVLSAAVKSCQSSSNQEFQALSDLNLVRNFVTGPVMLTFFDAPIAPVFFLAVYLIHPDLGYIVVASALLVLLVALINQKLTAVPFARAGGFAMRASLQADSMARNARVMNAMGMTREGVQVWGADTAESLKAQVSAQDRNIFMTGISKFIRLATQVAMLGWGAHLALNGTLTGGMIIAASIIGSRALAPVVGVIEGWGSFVHAKSGYGRIKSLLQSSPLNLQRLRLPSPTGRLSVERVLFVPPPNKKVILNGINFELEPGDSLAIMGGSGTGKTTLARMLVGSISPTAGSVRLDQMDIRHWDPRQFGESIGYLPQDVELFPASIKANISRMRTDVSDESIFIAAEIAGVHEMISQLPQGYETPIAVDGTPLSGGQKQRIGLARAFFGNPQLVVLDEPNSNLDTPGEVALSAALERAKRRKITVVTVTQRPSLLKSVDKIMLLKEGRVHLMGQRDEVIKQLSDARSAA